MDDATWSIAPAAQSEVKALAVRDNAVEIENDGVEVHGMLESAFCIFSPARIGTVSRFSFGGYGQSYSEL